MSRQRCGRGRSHTVAHPTCFMDCVPSGGACAHTHRWGDGWVCTCMIGTSTRRWTNIFHTTAAAHTFWDCKCPCGRSLRTHAPAMIHARDPFGHRRACNVVALRRPSHEDFAGLQPCDAAQQIPARPCSSIDPHAPLRAALRRSAARPRALTSAQLRRPSASPLRTLSSSLARSCPRPSVPCGSSGVSSPAS